MTQIYSIAHSSRQGLHQFLGRQFSKGFQVEQAIGEAMAIRKRHPNMGCRAMYELMQEVDFGRDVCERILLKNGFRLKRKKSPIKTTISNPSLRYPDLIKGLILTGINQVWQTDITYFLSPNCSVFFIIFIVDVYSRKIISWAANDHMQAEANITCLQHAITSRNITSSSKLIHHSDRGSQYGDKDYIALLKNHQIRISMCREAWQNAYTERINGTLKNAYLYSWDIEGLADLRRAVRKAVKAYNSEKPHRSLPSRMNPMAFETHLASTKKNTHPSVKIFNYEKK
jgi:transposase InsO family protein